MRAEKKPAAIAAADATAAALHFSQQARRESLVDLDYCSTTITRRFEVKLRSLRANLGSPPAPHKNTTRTHEPRIPSAQLHPAHTTTTPQTRKEQTARQRDRVRRRKVD